MERKHILQFIPEEYTDLTNNDKFIMHKENKLRVGSLIDLINTFITKSYFDKYNKNREFNMYSKILQGKYGCRYKQYLEWLIDKGFLVIESMWVKGYKSITYKVIYDIYNNKIIRVKNIDAVAIKRAEKYGRESNYSEIPSEIYDKLSDDLYSVELDYNNAKGYLDHLNNEGELSPEKYYRNSISIESLKEGSIYHNPDRYGRFHTNFTTLKKEIREQFLTIDGEKIKEIDIPNSQPMFLANVIKQDKFANDENFKDFFKSVYTGEFYKSFEDTRMTKKEIKKMVFKVFFDRNYNNRENKIFKSRWFNVWSFINDYKKRNKSYASLAWKLQRIESEFIIGTVCKQLMHQYPHIKIFTVHDSIHMKESDYELVRDVFSKFYYDGMCEDYNGKQKQLF